MVLATGSAATDVAKLIRLISAAEGSPTDTESIRAYQAERLGRHDSNNCILDLLPLPSPSVQNWISGQHSSLGELRDRASYTAAVAPRRIEHIRGQIQKYRPKAVIFYSQRTGSIGKQSPAGRFSRRNSPVSKWRAETAQLSC